MMKYLYIALSILLVLLILCSFTSLYVHKIGTITADRVAALQIGDLEQVCEIEVYWLRHAGTIDSLLRHEEHNQVTSELASLRAFMVCGEESDFLSTRESLVAMLRHIASTDLPLYYNLLTSPPGFYSVPA